MVDNFSDRVLLVASFSARFSEAFRNMSRRNKEVISADTFSTVRCCNYNSFGNNRPAAENIAVSFSESQSSLPRKVTSFCVSSSHNSHLFLTTCPSCSSEQMLRKMPIDIQPAWFFFFWSPAGGIFHNSASHLIPVNFATRIALLFFFALLHSAELPAHFGIGRVAPCPAWSLVRTKVKVAAVIMVPDVRKIVSLRILIVPILASSATDRR